MIIVKKIAIKDLESFFYSDFFKNLEFKPISEARVKSYLKNPRAKKDDIVIFMALEKEFLVGYRTILSDTFFDGGKTIDFGWLSGSWVHPKHRRKGISTLIFNEVLKEWDSKLMYSNYAISSKLLYDKTEQFKELITLEGTRFYMRFNLHKILPGKKIIFKKIVLVLKGIDIVLNSFFDIRYFFIKNKTEYRIEKNENLNNSIAQFIENNNNSFRRNIKEFEWIQEYPWVLSNQAAKNESNSYFFSVYSKDFESNIYTIYNFENQLIAIVFILIKNREMKIPYVFFKVDGKELVSDFIVNKINIYKVNTVTIYNADIEEELERKIIYIHKKNFVQKFFCTKVLSNLIDKKEKINIQSGDGDSVFT